MTLTRLSPIDGDAILPLADAKDQCRVRHSDEDALIAALRDVAISDVEIGSGVALSEAQFRWTMRGFPCRVDLPVRPVVSVDAVLYHDSTGVEATYDDARLIEQSVYPLISSSWPTAYDYAAVEFTAGPLPADKQAIALGAVRLLLEHLYENRGAVNIGNTATEIPLGVRSLMDKLRAIFV